MDNRTSGTLSAGADGEAASTERVHAILESISDYVVHFDHAWCIQYANAAMAQLLGRPAGELAGEYLWDLLPPPPASRLREQIERAMESREPAHFEGYSVLLDRWFECHCYPARDGLTLLARDISARKHEDEHLRGQLREVALLHDLSTRVVRAHDLEGVYEAALDAVLRGLRADRASILLFDDDRVIRFKAWRGLSDGYRAAVEGHSPWTPEVQQAEPIVVPNVAKDDSLGHYQEVILGECIRALAFVPLFCEGRLLGKFMVYFDEPHAYTEDEIRFAQTIANHIAFGIERKQAEQQLQASEARFRQIAETIEEVFYVAEPDGIQYISPGFERIWQRRAQELYEDPSGLLPAVHPDDRERVAEARRRQLAGERTETEYRILRTDGAQRWIRDRAFPLGDEAGRVSRIIGIAEDLTRRKQVEDALREREEELRLIMDHTPAGIVYIDADQRYAYVNAGFEQWFGQSRDEIVGRPIGEVLAPDVYERCCPYIESALAGQQVVFENDAPRRDGTLGTALIKYVPRFGCEGQVLGFYAMILDITERKRAEEALRESEQRYRLLSEITTDYIFSCDRQEDGTFLVEWISDAFERITGYQTEEVATRERWARFIHPEDMPLVQAFMARMHANQQHVMEHRFIHKNGQVGWLRVYGRPVWSEATGRVERILGAGQDVTTEKEALTRLQELNATLEQRVAERTAELERLNEALVRSNRELQDFAYVASHDLQEPLRKIQSFSDILLTEFGEVLGENGLEYLSRMQLSAERMTTLIRDLLSFSRIATKAEPFRVVDLNHIIDDVLGDLEIGITEAGGEVHVGELPQIEADPLQMRQLLQNLIGNAVKFHREGVPPVISVEVDPSETDPQKVRLVVSDNGIGFEEQYVERIFAPFQRLHGRSQYPGTGMGLAICRRIVDRHNGTITAYSRPGEGSRFIVELPVWQPQEEPRG